jgi:ankyrin repeat protein
MHRLLLSAVVAGLCVHALAQAEAPFDAAQAGDVRAVSKWLRDPGCNLAERDSEGRTALHRAVMGGRTQVLKLLLGNGAAQIVNMRDNGGRTAIHYAETPCAKLLVAAVADLAARDSDGRYVLHSTPSAETASLALKYGVKPDVRDYRGLTPLHTTRSAAVAGVLLSAGLAPDIRGGAGLTALHTTTSAEVAVALLKHTKPGVTDDTGATPLHTTPSAAVAAVLLASGADVAATDREGRLPLHTTPSAEVAGELLRRGAQLAATDRLGRTPLHCQAAAGHDAVVTALLDAKADLGAVDAAGATALHLAAAGGHVSTVRILLDAGADPATADADGATSLHMAASHGHPRVVELLIERKAGLDAATKSGDTPLAVARDAGSAGALLAAGAAVTTKREDGLTALHLAAQAGCPCVVEALVAGQVDPNVRDRAGRTPLHHALLSGHLYVARLLLARGAAIEAADGQGTRCLDLVSNETRVYLADLLPRRID